MLNAFEEFPHLIVIPKAHEAKNAGLSAENGTELQANATFEVVRSESAKAEPGVQVRLPK